MINARALQMVEEKLEPIIKSGKRIDNLKLMVSPAAPIACVNNIRTRFGALRVVPGEYIPKGCSYILEEPTGRRGRAFSWVSRNESNQIKNPPVSVGER